jgi:hypothetical protein
MNECINTFDGFTDWNKTFYYTDTDSFMIHHNQVKELEEKRPDLIGKKMGQFHDDIDEVENGKVIEAVFVRPKLYFLKVVGYSKNENKLVIVNHVRAKGIPKKFRDQLTIEDFKGMLFQQEMKHIHVE